MNSSIKNSLIIAICGAIFFVFLAFLMMFHHVIVDDYQGAIQRSDKKFAEILSENINQKLEKYFDFAKIPAQNPRILSSPEDFQKDLLKLSMESGNSYDYLMITDLSGKPLVCTDQRFINVDKNIYEWFKVMHPKFEPEISPAYYSEKTQNLVVTFVHKIEDNGEVKGAIMGDIRLTALRDMIKEFNKNNDCQAYLIDKSGTAISQPADEGRIYNYKSMNYETIAKNREGYAEYDKNGKIKLRAASFDVSPGLNDAIRAAMKGESGISEYQDSYYCYQPIKLPMIQTSWALVIEHSTEKVESNLIQIIKKSMAIGVVMIIIIGLALNQYARTITEPIRKMADMANRVKNGDLNGKLEIESMNELGELAENINHMIESIRKSQQKSKEAQDQLKVTAYYDALTGLPNRKYFILRLRQQIEKSVAGRFYGAMLFVDVDKFKGVNDTYGHAVGDGLLIEFAKRIVEIVGNKEYAGRYGGDEFLLFLPGYDEADVKSVSKSLVEIMHKPFKIAGNEFRLSASVGVALMPRDADDIDNLLIKADSALYVSKRSGRDRFTFYEEGMVSESKNMNNDF